MRVFSVGADGGFTEYAQLPFEIDHEESVLEKWLETNPDGILEDGRVLIIGRQVRTDLGGVIDLLGVDRQGNVVVVELKRDRTPRDVVVQALEYAAFAARLDVDALEGILRVHEQDGALGLGDHHREYFEVDESEAVAFNKDQRIVIVGQRVTPEIKQTALFLRSKGIDITCVGFTFFEAAGVGGYCRKRLWSAENMPSRAAWFPARCPPCRRVSSCSRATSTGKPSFPGSSIWRGASHCRFIGGPGVSRWGSRLMEPGWWSATPTRRGAFSGSRCIRRYVTVPVSRRQGQLRRASSDCGVRPRRPGCSHLLGET